MVTGGLIIGKGICYAIGVMLVRMKDMWRHVGKNEGVTLVRMKEIELSAIVSMWRHVGENEGNRAIGDRQYVASRW